MFTIPEHVRPLRDRVLRFVEDRVQPREADIQGARFSPVADILTRLGEFESWSQIAVRALFS